MIDQLNNKLEKIVINVGLGRLSSLPNFEEKTLPAINEELKAVLGQKAQTRPAKKSIAGFKLRMGTIVGLKATLRRIKMEQFLKKLVNVVLPRIRDFRGIDKKAIDRNGNLTIGIKEHSVFPEIILETSKANFGMEITLVPKIPIKEQTKAMEFYKTLKIPLKK